MNTSADLGARFLELTEDAMTHADQGTDPLAALVLIHGLGHVRLRDAFIAGILGEHEGARAILQGRQANLATLCARPEPTRIAAAHQLLDNLTALARHHDQRLLDPLASIRALLHWLDGRPTEALANLSQVNHSYSLANALRQVLILPDARSRREDLS